MKYIFLPLALGVLFLCSCNNSKTSQADSQAEIQNTQVDVPNKITADMAYEGVNNYCHEKYDWSVAEDNPDMMYIQMGEETDSAFQVVFRSYTGAFVYFYVDKISGKTRMVEKVPNLGVEEETGTIDLFTYLK